MNYILRERKGPTILPDIDFGYSIKMSMDDLSANIKIRQDRPITNRDIIDNFRALADRIEKEATAAAWAGVENAKTDKT